LTMFKTSFEKMFLKNNLPIHAMILKNKKKETN
jgi:hypothetical protein